MRNSWKTRSYSPFSTNAFGTCGGVSANEIQLLAKYATVRGKQSLKTSNILLHIFLNWEQQGSRRCSTWLPLLRWTEWTYRNWDCFQCICGESFVTTPSLFSKDQNICFDQSWSSVGPEHSQQTKWIGLVDKLVPSRQKNLSYWVIYIY